MQKRRRTGSKKISDSQEDSKSLPVYCICRSTDGERFMIACDRCEEWYHGDCINVTPKQAEQIKTFYCHQCRRKDPSLDIEYKTTRNHRSKVSRRPLSPGSCSSAYADQPSPVKPPKTKKSTASSSSTPHVKLSDERSSPSHLFSDKKFVPNEAKVSPASIIDGFGESAGPASPSGSYLHRNYWHRGPDQYKCDDEPLPSSQIATPAKMRPCLSKLRSCGNCSGCKQPEDCGKCDYCRDRRKFGGPNRMRQKCRLRQCIGGSNLARCRNPSSAAQGLGSRRRKQQTLQGVLLGPPSPSRLHQYTDFDDEQFEVPIDFSPRPYIDPSNSGIYGQPNIPIGSKMRRGDHRLQSTVHDLELMSSRSYPRMVIDGSIGSANSARNKDSVSGMFPLHSADGMDFLDDDSEDDLVISGPPHCAGPTCISAPLPGEKYCSEACRVKHANCRSNLRPTPRLGPAVHDTVIPYNLPYPDHMYCRHHRVYNWHSNNGTISSLSAPPPYRTINNSFEPHFAVESPYLSPEALPPTRGNHSNYAYNNNAVHPLGQRLPTSSPGLSAGSNNRLSTVLDEHHPVICDANDTNAFMIDSAMASAIHRGSVVPLVEDLDLELGSQHHAPTGSTHLSSSHGLVSVNSCYRPQVSSDSTRRHMVHRPDDQETDGVVDNLTPGDADEDGLDGSHGPNHHPVYSYHYMMMAYQNEEATNGHPTSRSQSLDSSAGDRRDRTLNHHPHHRLLLMPDGPDADVVNGMSSSVRGLALPTSASMRHNPLVGVTAAGVSVRPDSISAVATSTTASMTSSTIGTPQSSMAAFLTGQDEFYTINDSDDLEINWPQETVSGVNG